MAKTPKAKTKRVVIIGAGAVGCMAAHLLRTQGYDVSLLESNEFPLNGASIAANINHSDGFEYHKAGHQKTGEYCIDGAITKALFFQNFPHQEDGSKAYHTEICNVDNPIRFLVSKDSLGVDGLTEKSFYANAEHMREHFRKRFTHLSFNTTGGTRRVEEILGRNPNNFARRLKPEEYADCANIACGYAGSGAGVDREWYVRAMVSLLNKVHPDGQQVKTYCGRNVSAIEKQADGSYLVRTEHEQFPADQIMITAGHDVPQLCEKIKNAELCRNKGPKSADGTYYLNAMTYVGLVPTEDQALLKKFKHINFTLQGEGGAMFACIKPPTAMECGMGAVYYPSEKGSQLMKHVHDKDHPAPPPVEWNCYIKEGLPNDDPRVEAIMRQAFTYYPFLNGNAFPHHTLCRSVFNAANKENNQGLDRRERDIVDADIITQDGHVAAFRSPKWTNAELVAYMAVDQAMQALGDPALPKNKNHGYGPTNIDIEAMLPRDIGTGFKIKKAGGSGQQNVLI